MTILFSKLTYVCFFLKNVRYFFYLLNLNYLSRPRVDSTKQGGGKGYLSLIFYLLRLLSKYKSVDKILSVISLEFGSKLLLCSGPTYIYLPISSYALSCKSSNFQPPNLSSAQKQYRTFFWKAGKKYINIKT